MAFVIRGENHPLAIIRAGKNDRREATAHDVRVLEHVAAVEIERVDVVGGVLGQVDRRSGPFGLRFVFGVLEDLRGLLDIAAGLSVRRKENALAVRREPGVDVVPFAGGELVALRIIREIQFEKLRVTIDDG